MNKEQGFLLLVIAASAVLSLVILLPLMEFVLLAIILAYVLLPVNDFLKPYFGRRFSPIVVIFGAITIFVLPLLYIGLILYRDLLALAEVDPDLEISTIELWIQDVTGRDFDLETATETLGEALLDIFFGDIAHILSTAIFVAFGITVTFFVVYYLLRDGRAFVRWLITIAPVSRKVGGRLADQIDRTTYGVIVGHIAVAILQGIVGGIGFWIAGLPNVVFWSFVMVFLSLLPLIGPFLVWAPAAGYLFIVDQIPGAIFLTLWGIIVISMIDNYARPIIIDRDAHLNPAVILIGVFGGIYAIGLTGLFIGPIILAVLAASLVVFDEEWERLGRYDDD